MKPLIIYHAGCADGWSAAWWLDRYLIEGADLHPAKYGNPPPDCTGRHVFVVDFCYPGAQLDAIAEEALSLLVLDHHQTAEGFLADSLLTVVDSVAKIQTLDSDSIAVLDQTRSGVGLVAEYVQTLGGPFPPSFLLNIQDRDLWKFEMPMTREIFAAVSSRPHTIEAWDDMMLAPLLTEGQAIERYRNKLIEDTVETAFETEIGGYDVWCAAAPYAIGSDVAGELAKRKPELFGAYFVDYGTKVRFGLRSTPTGLDVAAIAEKWWDGGGHRHAAGFEILGWWDSWEHHHDLTDFPTSRGPY